MCHPLGAWGPARWPPGPATPRRATQSAATRLVSRPASCTQLTPPRHARSGAGALAWASICDHWNCPLSACAAPKIGTSPAPFDSSPPASWNCVLTPLLWRRRRRRGWRAPCLAAAPPPALAPRSALSRDPLHAGCGPLVDRRPLWSAGLRACSAKALGCDARYSTRPVGGAACACSPTHHIGRPGLGVQPGSPN